MDLETAEWLRNSKVQYIWTFKPWEEPSIETVIILQVGRKRVKILLSDDTVKWVDPSNLREI